MKQRFFYLAWEISEKIFPNDQIEARELFDILTNWRLYAYIAGFISAIIFYIIATS